VFTFCINYDRKNTTEHLFNKYYSGNLTLFPPWIPRTLVFLKFKIFNSKHFTLFMIKYLTHSITSLILMIKGLKHPRAKRARKNFYVCVIKTNNGHIEKNAAPKRQLDKILGPRARPLRPHFRRLWTIWNSSDRLYLSLSKV